jgi:hypothetical protein
MLVCRAVTEEWLLNSFFLRGRCLVTGLRATIGNKDNPNVINTTTFPQALSPHHDLIVDVMLCMYVYLYVCNITFRERMRNTGEAGVELGLLQV